MTLTITQTCNGCGDTRKLDGIESHSTQRDGWREVMNGKHLCPKCIKKAIKHGEQEPV